MLNLLLSTGALVLTPVVADDPVLFQDETFVSEAAQAQIASDADARPLCLALPEDAASHRRVCMVEAEWQAVFDRIEQERRADLRQRAIGLAQWYASAR